MATKRSDIPATQPFRLQHRQQVLLFFSLKRPFCPGFGVWRYTQAAEFCKCTPWQSKIFIDMFSHLYKFPVLGIFSLPCLIAGEYIVPFPGHLVSFTNWKPPAFRPAKLLFWLCVRLSLFWTSCHFVGSLKLQNGGVSGLMKKIAAQPLARFFGLWSSAFCPGNTAERIKTSFLQSLRRPQNRMVCHNFPHLGILRFWANPNMSIHW